MKNEILYCVEFITNGKHCRSTLSEQNYIELSDAEDKVQLLNKYYNNQISITKFVKQFKTTDQDVLIGAINGTEMEY